MQGQRKARRIVKHDIFAQRRWTQADLLFVDRCTGKHRQRLFRAGDVRRARCRWPLTAQRAGIGQARALAGVEAGA
jgi:hypothetical protein